MRYIQLGRLDRIARDAVIAEADPHGATVQHHVITERAALWAEQGGDNLAAALTADASRVAAAALAAGARIEELGSEFRVAVNDIASSN